MDKIVEVIKTFRKHAKAYKYLAFTAIIFLLWQIGLNLLVQTKGGEVTTDKFVVICAFAVFFLGLLSLIWVIIDFIKIIKNRLNMEYTNKPLLVYDALLIIYIIGVQIIRFIF